MVKEPYNQPEEGDIYPAGHRQAQQEQAVRLQDAAARTGLLFEAFLTPDAALWALKAVETGTFATPAELAWTAVQQFIEMKDHPDLLEELRRRKVQAAIDDPRAGIPFEEVLDDLQARAVGHMHQKPVRWSKSNSADKA